MQRSHHAYDAIKRLVDVVVAACALMLLSPVLLVVALLVRFGLGSPVIFRQVRPGLHGKPFTILKFRTMSDDTRASAGSPDAVVTDAERLTSLGRALRSTSLDELPELWNVLVGEMSIVGPRPLLMDYLGRYNERQARRHEVRPGITGWAQVNGRNAVSWEDRFEMDTWYVENRSAILDLRILARTVGTVVSRKGVSSEGHATMEPFGQSTSNGTDREDS